MSRRGEHQRYGIQRKRRENAACTQCLCPVKHLVKAMLALTQLRRLLLLSCSPRHVTATTRFCSHVNRSRHTAASATVVGGTATSRLFTSLSRHARRLFVPRKHEGWRPHELSNECQSEYGETTVEQGNVEVHRPQWQ